MKPIPIRQPGLSVILRKNVGRATLDGKLPVSQRFAGQNKTINLTPFIGEQGRVVVRKSVREPAGSFTITFGDQISDADDTVYGLVEPMDVIEIRMAGDAYEHPKSASTGNARPASLPIMMRGLVSRVHRHEGMGQDGKPQRFVTVSGQDYGKIWQILQIFNSPYVDPTANLITSMPFYAQFGQALNTNYAEDFVKDVFKQVINPFIDKMREQATGSDKSTSPLMNISTEGVEISDGIVSPFGIGGWAGGTIYSLLQEHCDTGAWNELYIEDRESGPVVVYRPNPFIDLSGTEYVMPMKVEPKFVPITRTDVVSIDVERSDEHMANYFWVDAPRFALNYGESSRQFAYMAKPEEVYLQNYGNVSPKLYGIRRMWEQTQQGGRDEKSNGNGTQAGSARTISENSCIEWMNKRRRQLVAMNKDNVILESGSMTLKGNEALRAGTYARLSHGGMVSDYYGVAVTHDYVPFQRYITQLDFERGTGFADRVAREGGKQSPYWGEVAE